MNKESLLPFSIEVMVNILKNLSPIHTRDVAKIRPVSKQFNESYLALAAMNNGGKNPETQFINQLTKYMLGENFCNTFIKCHQTDYVSMFDFFVGQCQKTADLSVIQEFKVINRSDFDGDSWGCIQDDFTPQFERVKNLLEKHGLIENSYEYAISLFAIACIKQFPKEKGVFNLFLVTPSTAAVKALHFYDPTIIFSKWEENDEIGCMAFVDLFRIDIGGEFDKSRNNNLVALYEMFNKEEKNKFNQIIYQYLMMGEDPDIEGVIDLRKLLKRIISQVITECIVSKEISPQMEMFSTLLDKFIANYNEKADHLVPFMNLLLQMKNLQLEIKDAEIKALKQKLIGQKRNVTDAIDDSTDRHVRQKR